MNVSLLFANETNPPIAPRFMESSAELGTITIEPFSFKPSNTQQHPHLPAPYLW